MVAVVTGFSIHKSEVFFNKSRPNISSFQTRTEDISLSLTDDFPLAFGVFDTEKAKNNLGRIKVGELLKME
jgi:hypothetical protein